MFKKVTILMTVYNHLDLTKKALESLYSTTNKEDYHLIIIDNGSLQETKNYLDNELSILFPNMDYEVIHQANMGWIKAINNNYKKINTFYFLTCHNDIIFEKDWLLKMLKRFSDDDNIAMVGPTSNFILG